MEPRERRGARRARREGGQGERRAGARGARRESARGEKKYKEDKKNQMRTEGGTTKKSVAPKRE